LFILEFVMSQHPSPEDLARITSALMEFPRPTITGAVLGTLLRQVAPTLDVRAAVDLPVGTGALSRFTDIFLQKVLRKCGHTAQDGTGGDNVYEILRNERANVTDVGDSHPDAQNFWGAFVRSSDNNLLSAVRDGAAVGLRVGATIPENGVQIEKPSPSEFESIASSFIEQLEGAEVTSALALQLRQVTSYDDFIQSLKRAGSTYFLKWSAHRRDLLRRLFLQRLESAGFSLPERQHLLSELDRSQQIARLEQRYVSADRIALPAKNVRPNQMPTISGEQFEREFLKAIIDRMSMQELRSLPITFGQALDAVQTCGLHK
jgi:hypothetical protein